LVAYHDAASNSPAAREVTLDKIGIQAADLVTLAGSAHGATTEIDDRLAGHAFSKLGARPDAPVAIRYMEKQNATFSVFEVLPLVRALRTLTSGARPLRPSDLSLASEARASQNVSPEVDAKRIRLVDNAMRTLAGNLSTLITKLEALPPPAAPPPADPFTVADSLAADAEALLARAALFGGTQAGRAFIHDYRRRVFAGVIAQASELVNRWTAQLADFDARIAAHDALPASAADAERFRVLAAAEATISTRPLVPRPASPAAFRTELVGTKRPAFAKRHDAFRSLQRTKRTRVADLIADLRALVPVSEFDSVAFSVAEYEKAVAQFAKEAAAIASSVRTTLNRRLAEAGTQFAAHDASGVAADRARALELAAKALLGDDFVIIPQFALTTDQGKELVNALEASRSGALFDHLVHPAAASKVPIDFPVDTWLHGTARVRDRLRAWEQTTLLTGAFGRTEPALDALQLPHVPGDRWVALELAPDQKLDSDRLLYTAHFASPFDAASRLCGLVVDEWTETIPVSEIDAGIAFHYDRPNAEAPQTMLLVTPSEFRGGWQFDDLVDAINETLDLAKRRAVEPVHLDKLPFAPYLPATIMAAQSQELTIAANLALNNRDVPEGE
jgi:hypothetical protein